ncbi:MAG: enoyl-ACP reductase [Planctomycetes bacterium]|nr:enoyl-ACP reductase [Planctomycetota bacterium]
MITIDFSNKKGVILGVANKRSIALGIAKTLSSAGATIGYNYLNERMKEMVEDEVLGLPGTAFTLPMDVTKEEELEAFFARASSEFGGKIDFVVHSLAFAERSEFERDFIETSRDGYLQAIEISAYSAVRIAKHAKPLFEANGGGAMIALSYIGGERVVSGYKLMGPAKAALEANMKYIAYDLGKLGVRVNTISAGPVKTLSLAGIPGGKDLMKNIEGRVVLGRNITVEDVGNAGLFLLSDLASGITGETLHVDAGYHVLGI